MSTDRDDFLTYAASNAIRNAAPRSIPPSIRSMQPPIEEIMTSGKYEAANKDSARVHSVGFAEIFPVAVSECAVNSISSVGSVAAETQGHFRNWVASLDQDLLARGHGVSTST